MISTNTAVFYCIATAKPVASIGWLRDGSVLNRSQINVTYSTDGKDCNDDNPNNQCTSYSVLQLFNTQPADSGQYVCNASNEYASDLQSISLTIQGKIINILLNIIHCDKYVRMYVYKTMYESLCTFTCTINALS